MPDLKSLAAILLLPTLVCCSSQKMEIADDTKTEAEAKTEMIGMSKEETFTCMGLPANKKAEGQVETWSYALGACTVSLTIAGDGKVRSVDYSTTPVKDKKGKVLEDQPTLEEQCAHVPMVLSCLRWLRN